MRKYRNNKVTVDGIEFDSKKEAVRYSQLKALLMAGEIANLELQREFELIPNQRGEDGKVIERAVKYRSDFAYMQDGRLVVEDVKGYRDPKGGAYAKFVLKRKMMLYFYGIRVKEI